jgi:glutaredoxin 3
MNVEHRMKPVEIYTSPLCGFCHAAKRLLKQKGIEFSEIDVFANPKRKPEMIERAGGRRTVPQIFVGQTHVGGCDDRMIWNVKASLIRCLRSDPKE